MTDTWQDKIERLRHRKPLQSPPITLHDDDAHDALRRAQRAYTVAVDEAAGALGVDATQLQDATEAEQKATLRKIEGRAAVKRAKKALEEAHEWVQDADTTFVFRALPGDVYEDLQAEHPPTDEQAERGEAYNVKTFAPALVAACSVDEVTEEQAVAIFAALSQGERSVLFNGAVAVNENARASLGKG